MGGCPCASNELPMSNTTKSFHVGTCASVGFSTAASEKTVDVSAGKAVVSIFKKPVIVEPQTVYALDLTHDGECEQIVATPPKVKSLAQRVQATCSPWSMMGCGAAVAGALLACGDFNFGCIIGLVSKVSGCAPCFCQSMGCPMGCPCASNELPMSNTSKSFHVGSCADAGFTLLMSTQPLTGGRSSED